ERNLAPRCRSAVARFLIACPGCVVTGEPPAFASDCDDCPCDRGRHVALGTRVRGRISDASAAGNGGYRRNSGLDGAVADHHPCRALLPESPVNPNASIKALVRERHRTAGRQRGKYLRL